MVVMGKIWSSYSKGAFLLSAMLFAPYANNANCIYKAVENERTLWISGEGPGPV